MGWDNKLKRISQRQYVKNGELMYNIWNNIGSFSS